MKYIKKFETVENISKYNGNFIVTENTIYLVTNIKTHINQYNKQIYNI
jgi:hypothetical protein